MSNLVTKLDTTATPGHFLKEWEKIFFCDLGGQEREREQKMKEKKCVGECLSGSKIYA